VTAVVLTPDPSDDDLLRLLGACGLRVPAECGTTAAYIRHYRRGEKPCPACKEANVAAARDRRAAGIKPARPIREHGTPAGARTHQRRHEPACGPCARAYRTYQNEQRAAKKARAAA
jgi:hypothetical protein